MSRTPRWLELGQHLHPELGALAVLKPHAEHVAVAVDGDAQGEVAGLALDRAALADLEHQRVEEHDRVDILKRPFSPFADVVHHRVGDLRDQLTADLHAVDLLQVRLDVSRGQAPGVERQDLVVEPPEAPLALPDELRLKAPVAVAGGVDRHRPLVGDQRLGRRAVARIVGAALTGVRQLLGTQDAKKGVFAGKTRQARFKRV